MSQEQNLEYDEEEIVSIFSRCDKDIVLLDNEQSAKKDDRAGIDCRQINDRGNCYGPFYFDTHKPAEIILKIIERRDSMKIGIISKDTKHCIYLGNSGQKYVNCDVGDLSMENWRKNDIISITVNNNLITFTHKKKTVWKNQKIPQNDTGYTLMVDLRCNGDSVKLIKHMAHKIPDHYDKVQELEAKLIEKDTNIHQLEDKIAQLSAEHEEKNLKIEALEKKKWGGCDEVCVVM
eukprot:439520_1